jgi:hypothetical protein
MADGVRYLLRKNEAEAAREQHRLEDKLAKLSRKVEQRNEQVSKSPRCQPEAGPRNLQFWVARHKLTGLVELRLEGRTMVLERNPVAIERAMELAGCYVVVTDVAKEHLSGQEVHDSYVSLQKVERDFRQRKTGLVEVRPVFVRKESRTRGHVFCCLLALKLSRELERRLQAAFGTTDSRSPRDHAGRCLGRLEPSVPAGIPDRRENHDHAAAQAGRAAERDLAGTRRDAAGEVGRRRQSFPGTHAPSSLTEHSTSASKPASTQGGRSV